MGGVLHLVQRGGPGWAAAPPIPLLAVPNVTAHPSTSSVPITVLLYDGPLFCGFTVAIKVLIVYVTQCCGVCVQSLEQKMLMATHAKTALEQDQRQLRRRLAELTAESYRDVTGTGSSGFRPLSRSPTSSESAASTNLSYSPSPSDYGQSMNPLQLIVVR